MYASVCSEEATHNAIVTLTTSRILILFFQKTHSHDMAVDSALKNSKGDMKKLKTSFAIQRAKDKAEHAQSALMKEKQLKEMVGSFG